MSFPVPVEYGMNDSRDNTEIVYNNGSILPGLPSVPGVCPENVLSYYEITMSEDIDASKALTFSLKPADNFCVLLVALSPISTPDEDHNYIPWFVGETSGANLFRFGRYLQANGSMGGQTTGVIFFSYNEADNSVSFPDDARYHMLAGQKYALYQIRLANVNEV